MANRTNFFGETIEQNPDCIVIRYPNGKRQRFSSDITGWYVKNYTENVAIIVLTGTHAENLAIVSLMPGMVITFEKYLQ